MTKRFLRWAVGIGSVVLAGGCTPGDDGTVWKWWPNQEPPPPGATLACFSPSQSPALSLDEPNAGCPCSGSAGVCVRTEYDGRPWDVALVCEGGRWQGVEDGPCAPSLPNPANPPATCLVEGQRYADGERVPDPYSCNTCFCEDGQVSVCTEIGCADPCPTGTTPGTSCAECGPTDACESVETTCLRSCSSNGDCTDPAHSLCLGGQCRNACG